MQAKMNKIKFSHRYEKLENINEYDPVTLLDCISVRLLDLSDKLIEYDTVYYEADEIKHYKLNNGDYLLLLFVDNNNNLFTTIRRATPSKTDYYMTAIGSKFELVFI